MTTQIEALLASKIAADQWLAICLMRNSLGWSEEAIFMPFFPPIQALWLPVPCQVSTLLRISIADICINYIGKDYCEDRFDYLRCFYNREGSRNGVEIAELYSDLDDLEVFRTGGDDDSVAVFRQRLYEAFRQDFITAVAPCVRELWDK